MVKDTIICVLVLLLKKKLKWSQILEQIETILSNNPAIEKQEDLKYTRVCYFKTPVYFTVSSERKHILHIEGITYIAELRDTGFNNKRN